VAALFERDGDKVVPTGLTRGPWDPNAMNGGAVASLLARAAEQHDDAGAPILEHHLLARMTIDLVRPAPLTPLTVATTTVRPGKKIQLVEVLVRSGDDVVSRAVVLRMPAAYDELEPSHEVPPPGPNTFEVQPMRRPQVPVEGLDHFHTHGVEMRSSPRPTEGPRVGPALIWIRLAHPVFEGETPSGAVRAATAADFGSGVSGIAPPGWRSINTDISVHLYRQPVGEWICFEAQSRAGTGVGVASGPLYDETTRVGNATQSVLMEPWQGWPTG
jgi:acyl-coenzyme A thioesterase PaaI-like protein